MPANVHIVIVVIIAEKKTIIHKFNGNGLNNRFHFSRNGCGLGTKNFKHVNVQNLDMSTIGNLMLSIQSEQNAISTFLIDNHLSAPPVTVKFGQTVPHLSLSSDVYTSHVTFNLVAISLKILHSTPLDKPILVKYRFNNFVFHTTIQNIQIRDIIVLLCLHGGNVDFIIFVTIDLFRFRFKL